MLLEPVRELISHEISQLDQRILDRLHTQVPLVRTICEHVISSGGKRLRPTLSLLVAKSLGVKDFDRVIELAAVIEYIHTATLLHDDVIDDSQLRRGKKTANVIWDNSASVLVGDFLVSRALQMLVAIDSMQVINLLARITNKIAEGEVLQLSKRHDPTTTIEEYLRIVELKTGVLFAAACEGSALLATSDAAVISAGSNYGLNLGIAFQMIDDALDYQGDEALLGKQIGDDLAEGKPTLPLIYALNHTEGASHELIKEAIKTGNKDLLPQLLEIIRQTRALTITEQYASRYLAEAKQCLSSWQASEYKTALLDLTEFVVERNY